MRIVGITACPTGIAHTYITKQKIVEAAKECGFPCHIETQGTIGDVSRSEEHTSELQSR